MNNGDQSIMALVCECHGRKVVREKRAPFLKVLRDGYECPVTGEGCSVFEGEIQNNE